MKIKIIDRNFAHAQYSSDYQDSKYIVWDRTAPSQNDLVFITDTSLPSPININIRKIAWLMEPREIFPSNYKWMENNHHRFEHVLTYDKELISLSRHIHFSPHCGCWIKPKDQMIYNKTKIVSIVSSNKTQTSGHKLRHSVISMTKNNNIELDVYGRVYNPIDYKLTAMKDYAFALVIENCKMDYYFTEKLIDAFTTGTVPIYWGCPSIGDFFNIDGVIIVDTLEDFRREMSNLSIERYESMKDAIADNLIRSKKYLLAEDWIYNNTNLIK
jgi:hypothetical protein